MALRADLNSVRWGSSTSLTPRRSTVILIHSYAFSSSSSLLSTGHATSYRLRIPSYRITSECLHSAKIVPKPPGCNMTTPSSLTLSSTSPSPRRPRSCPRRLSNFVQQSQPRRYAFTFPYEQSLILIFVYPQPSEAPLATASVFLSLRKLALGELKDNSHTRKKPVGHINRPPNAFILFRCIPSICLPNTVTHPDLGALNAPRCLAPVVVTSSAYPILLPPFGALWPIPSSLLGMRLRRMSRSSTSSSSLTTSSSHIPRMQQTKRNTARQT